MPVLNLAPGLAPVTQLNSLQKVLFRYALSATIEALSRLQQLFNTLENTPLLPGTSAGVSQGFAVALNQLEQRVFASQGQWAGLFSDASETREASGTCDWGTWWQAMADCRTDAALLGQALWAVFPQPLPSELTPVLNEVAPLNQLQSFNERMVCLNNAAPPMLPGVLTETLSVLDWQNPLAWPLLISQYTQTLYQEHRSVWVTVPLNQQAPAAHQQDDLLATLVPHLLGIRLLGPAYYEALVHQALQNNTLQALQPIEGALFYALNFFNVAPRSAVLLHEALAAYLSTPLSQGSQASSAPVATLWSPTVLDALLKAVESLIPNAQATSPKTLEPTERLQERLIQGLPISALAACPALEAAEQMTELLHPTEATDYQLLRQAGTLYEWMSLLDEQPLKATTMLNAAWQYRLKALNQWVFDDLVEPQLSQALTSANGLQAVSQKLANLDALILKSLETAQLHRLVLGLPLQETALNS